MHFAFCLFKYFPYGGLQRDCLQTIQYCLLNGHEVTVFTRSWQGEKPNDINIKIIKTNALSNHGKNWQFAKKLQKQLNKQEFNAVIGFNKIPGLDAYFAADSCYLEKIANKKNIFVYLTRRFWLLSRLEKAVFSKNSKTHIFYLALAEKSAYQKYYELDDDRFTKVAPGIAKDKFINYDFLLTRNNKRKSLGIDENIKLILFVGSGFAIKGLELAIKAFALIRQKYKKIYFIIAGSGNDSGYLKLINKLRLTNNIKFLGARDDIPALMQAADCLLHPAYKETGANVLLEAAFSGLPVVTTMSCGYAEYINSANMGEVLINPKIEQIANAVEKVLNSDRNIYQINSKKLQEKFTEFGQAQQILTWLESFSREEKCS